MRVIIKYYTQKDIKQLVKNFFTYLDTMLSIKVGSTHAGIQLVSHVL